MLPYIASSLLDREVSRHDYQNSTRAESTQPTAVSILMCNVMALEMSSPMSHWKSQLEVKREGPRYEELRVYAVYCSSAGRSFGPMKCVLMGTHRGCSLAEDKQ